MKPAPFEYRRPETIDAALELLAELGEDCKVLAGGQSLIPLMNLRLARPSVLVDLGRVDELKRVYRAGSAWRVGAMTTQARLEEIDGLPSAVTAALPSLAHFQIRSRSTLGGSLAHLDPAAEWPALALALGATVTVRSRSRTRVLEASDLIAGPYAPTLLPDELLTEIELPDGAPRQAFVKVSRRPGDFALGGAALSWPTGDAPRLALFGIEPVQRRLVAVENALHAGLRPGPELRALVAAEVDPKSDVHATADHRRRLATILVDRVVVACA